MAETNIKLFDKQISALEFLNDNITNELLYGGGARGGKSWLGCVWQCMRRFAYPGSAGLIGREELKKLKDTTQLTFFKVLAEYGWRDYVEFNAQSQIATFKNGSRIFFSEIAYLPSDPEFDRLGSYDLTDYFLDEAQQIHYKAISVLKGRTSLLIGPGWRTIPKALYTCNPKLNWIYSEFVRPARDNTLPGRKKFIAALPTDNPYCPPEYIENLKTADKVTQQRLLYGNFEYDDDPAALCEQDAIFDLFTNEHVLPIEDDKYISADLAMQGRDKFVAGVWSGMVCDIKLSQDKSTGKSIESDLQKLMIKYSVGRSHTVADSDGLGNYLVSYLEGIKTFHGNAKATDPEYANLKAECGFKLAELVNSRSIHIICTPEQKQAIIEELGALKRDDIDNDEAKKSIIDKKMMKELIGRSPDYLDMLLMRMIWECMPRPAQISLTRRHPTRKTFSPSVYPKRK